MGNITLFDPYTVDEQAIMLAHHMPLGRVWESAFDINSNMGKLVYSLGIEMYRLELLTKQISDEIDINKTAQLIEEWEKSVGVPDSCFTNDVTLEDRRKQILQKFSRFGGVQKAEDFIRVALVFGYTVDVYPAVRDYTFPLTFPLPFLGTKKDVKHTIIVEMINFISEDVFFPLDFPIVFSSGGSSFLKCIFEKLAPANVRVYFII